MRISHQSRWRWRWRSKACAALAVLVGPFGFAVPKVALAQTLVLPVTVAESPGAAGTVAASQLLENRLRAGGAQLLSSRDAIERFEHRESAAPSELDRTDFDVIAEQAQQALLYVATGRNQRARDAVAEVMDRAEHALESLNREAESATTLLDSCLFSVRAMLAARDREGARQRAYECRRLVPDIEPEPYTHPPQVRELYDQVRQELERGGGGRLSVQTEVPGCDIVLNGRRLGTTPFVVAHLPPGEYRVQAECGNRPGRVHRVVLAAEGISVSIDTRFDRHLNTSGALSFRYPTAANRLEYGREDALHVARVVDAEELVVVTTAEDGIRYHRIRVADAAVLATVHGPPGPSAADSDEVAALLAQQRSYDLVQGGELVLTEAPPSAVAAAEMASTSFPWEGWVLFGSGVALFATSWVFYGNVRSDEDTVRNGNTVDKGFLDAVDSANTFRWLTGTTALAGGVLTTIAVPMLVPDVPARDGIPWWGWVAGGVGVAGVALGTVLAVQPAECLNNCFYTDEPWILGLSVASHAAPFLAVPLTYLIRSATHDPTAAASVEVTPDGAQVALRWAAF